MTRASSPEPRATAAASWLGVVATALVLAAVIAAAQSHHYSATFDWNQRALTLGDHGLLFWVIASSSLWALSPGVVLAGALLLFGKHGAAWLTAAINGAAICFWAIVDLRVDIVTGKHAFDYARFLGGEAPWQWAGGLSEIFWPMALLGSSAALAALAGIALAFFATRRAPRLGFAAVAAACLVYSAALLGPLGVAPTSEHPLLLRRLCEALPLEPPLLDARISRATRDAAWVGELNENLPQIYSRYAKALSRVHPVENPQLRVNGDAPPNVIVVVLESFRFESIDPRWMPRVDAFARAHALRSSRHYSTSHASHLGLFSLLFGQSPLVYETTLDARIAAQLPHTLRRNGYYSSLLSSSALDWQRMEDFLSPRNFDELRIEDVGRWPMRDARTLAHLRARLLASAKQPQFALVFLMSTHYNYQYPPAYERHTPVVQKGVLSWDRLLEGKDVGPQYREGLLNRYRNSLAYLDDRLGEWLETLDLTRNIVIVTGDHGESFYDDGRWLHGSRLSDAQLRVPWFIAGPGIAPGELPGPTSHLDVLPTVLHAVAGRPVPLARAQGRDLLGKAARDPADLLLVGMGAKYRHLLLLHGDERMHLRVDYAGSALQTLGFLDEQGGYLPEDDQTRTDPIAWLDAVDRQLGAITR